jgi:hypothetical protein
MKDASSEINNRITASRFIARMILFRKDSFDLPDFKFLYYD